MHVALLDPSRADVRGDPSARVLSPYDLLRVPGLISLARLALAVLFPLALRRPRHALVVLIAAGASDVLDGWYARHFHEQTTTGALIDGIADKVFALAVVTSLVNTRTPFSGGDRRSLSLLDIALLGTRELGELALALRLTADRRRRRRLRVPSANASGKLATTLQFVAIGAVILGSRLRNVLIGATAIAGVGASISYWRRELSATRP